MQMIMTVICLLSTIGLIWELIILPQLMKQKIKKLAQVVNAEVIDMKLLSRIQGIYLVDVKDAKEQVKMKAKYDMLGKVEWVKA